MSDKPARQLILVELNEINFKLVDQYTSLFPGRFRALERLRQGCAIRTAAETDYTQLEPWMQWVSVHSGRSYAEHQIFRLGDVVGSDVPQLFEQVERMGIKVGCISPMNAENRLRDPAYFIPDPWTKTPSDGSWWSRALTQAVGQVVNDNSRARISPRSALALLLGLLRFSQPRHYGHYLRLGLRARGAPWRKALLLDLFLHDLHLNLLRRTKPGFSTVFLNAGAHIQHHYMLNAIPVKNDSSLRNPAWYVNDSEDPVAEMLETYDLVIGELLDLQNTELIIATGLAQQPYDRLKYYYRLREHESFVTQLGIKFLAVHPRMTRDFLVEFHSPADALDAQVKLSSIRVCDSNSPLFAEIDNRGTSLFVTLTFPEEIRPETKFEFNGQQLPLLPHVAFVAIKNGMHQCEGYAFFTEGTATYAPTDGSHVKELCDAVLHYATNNLAPSRINAST